MGSAMRLDTMQLANDRRLVHELHCYGLHGLAADFELAAKTEFLARIVARRDDADSIADHLDALRNLDSRRTLTQHTLANVAYKKACKRMDRCNA